MMPRQGGLKTLRRMLRRRGLLRAPEEQVLKAIGEAVRTRRHGLRLPLMNSTCRRIG